MGPCSDDFGQGGGGEKALGRHAVAALLNAATGGVDYAFAEADVIAMVQNAYATGDFNGIKDLLQAENERGCPLGSSCSEPKGPTTRPTTRPHEVPPTSKALDGAPDSETAALIEPGPIDGLPCGFGGLQALVGGLLGLLGATASGARRRPAADGDRRLT